MPAFFIELHTLHTRHVDLPTDDHAVCSLASEPRNDRGFISKVVKKAMRGLGASAAHDPTQRRKRN